jgi:hypothetical protein
VTNRETGTQRDRVWVGEVLEWRRGVWRVVKIGNVTVSDRRRIR